MTYEVANGAEIHNEGEKTFSGCIGTVGGGVSKERAVRAQVCAVHQPLLSVKGMCRSGHRVVFDEDGSFIENKRTLERLKIEEVDGEYVLDMWVKIGQDDASQTFGGQRK